MAEHIKLIKNNIKSSSSYGKYFAKAVSQGKVTLNEIAEKTRFKVFFFFLGSFQIIAYLCSLASRRMVTYHRLLGKRSRDRQCLQNIQ